VPTITGDSAIDVAIGLAFLFFLLSIVASSANEAIAQLLKLRAKTLESGIRALIADPAKAESFFQNWRIDALSTPTIFRRTKRPSYIPPRAFALTLLDTFAPPATGTSEDLIGRANAAIKQMQDDATATAPAEGQQAPNPDPVETKVLGMLQDAVDRAGTSRTDLVTEIETQFNDVMDRVSGWYKRRSQVILFAIALVLAGALNVDTFTIGQRLWKDDALRAAIVAQANATITAGKAVCTTATPTSATSGNSTTGNSATTGTTNPTPLDTAANCVAAVKQLGLPIGWSEATSPKHGWQFPTKILGLLVTAFAVMLGAPFWFDFLGKAAQLRSSGAKPDKTTSGT
jgi:hypothetical protein